jgi:hypothetical protein
MQPRLRRNIRSDPPRPAFTTTAGKESKNSVGSVPTPDIPKPKGGPGFRGLPKHPFQIRSPQKDDPPRREVLSCSADKACPNNEVCVQRSGTGQCVGQSCYMRGQNKEPCPISQICIAKPRRDGAVISDVPGLCTDRTMQCSSASTCAPGWACQKQPNGDGPISSIGTGLCIHFGDGQSERSLELT